MGVLSRVVATSVSLCCLFATFVFFTKLMSFTFLGFSSPRLTSRISEPSLGKWNLENATSFLPGVTNRLYRQEIYSRAVRHHSRHLHGIKKYHVSRLKPINHTFKRVCYLTVPTEEWPTLHPSEIEVDLCTHIVIGFAKIVDGNLIPMSINDEIFYRDVIALKSHAPELKIMLSVGGANNDRGFRKVISTLNEREEFAVNSANYLKSVGFDGLDLDWEFPAWYNPFDERFLFQQLLQELHFIYKNPVFNLTISVAVAASKSIIDRSYRVAQMANYVDFVSMMGYDFHSFKWYLPMTGHNSPLYPRSDEWTMFATVNLNWTAFYWIQLGMPREKLVIGLPTYGQTYQLYNPNFHGVYAPAIGAGTVGIGGQVAYPAVCQFLADGASREYDSESRVPYSYKKRTWISYDDEQSLEEKSRWIRNNQFGGVMVFDLNCDDFIQACGNTTFPLLKSILHGLSY